MPPRKPIGGTEVVTIPEVAPWEIADRPLTEPHPGRLAPDHPLRRSILAAHADALEAGSPGYTDPGSGLFVLTSSYLAGRGSCCDRGCRHCPYVV